MISPKHYNQYREDLLRELKNVDPTDVRAFTFAQRLENIINDDCYASVDLFSNLYLALNPSPLKDILQDVFEQYEFEITYEVVYVRKERKIFKQRVNCSLYELAKQEDRVKFKLITPMRLGFEATEKRIIDHEKT